MTPVGLVYSGQLQVTRRKAGPIQGQVSSRCKEES
jgi:hypothetical protein